MFTFADIEHELVLVETEGGFYRAHPDAKISPSAKIGPQTTVWQDATIAGESEIGNSVSIGPKAEVIEAKIGDGSGIWSHSKVMTGADLGESVGVGHATIINAGVILGDRVRVQNHVSIPHGVTAESYVFIGPGAKFPNDRHPRTFGAWAVGESILGFGSSFGANAVVVCGEAGKPTEVGEFAMLAAGTTATRSLRPFGLYVGNKQKGWVNLSNRTVSRDPTELPAFDTLVSLSDRRALEKDSRLKPGAAALIIARAEVAYDRLIFDSNAVNF